MTEQHHPAPWWYRLAERFMPGRCREIPEAVNPNRIVLRQVALIKRYVYLQQFASSEDNRWAHSHQWRYTIALGLWGSYWEERPGQAVRGGCRRRVAPYLYAMDDSVIHRVFQPAPGHTSIFVGLFRDDDMKRYFDIRETNDTSRLWSEHIKVMVKRI